MKREVRAREKREGRTLPPAIPKTRRGRDRGLTSKTRDTQVSRSVSSTQKSRIQGACSRPSQPLQTNTCRRKKGGIRGGKAFHAGGS